VGEETMSEINVLLPISVIVFFSLLSTFLFLIIRDTLRFKRVREKMEEEIWEEIGKIKKIIRNSNRE